MNKEEYEEFSERLKDYRFDNDKIKKYFVKAIDNKGDFSTEELYSMASEINTLTEQALLLAFANVLYKLSKLTK